MLSVENIIELTEHEDERVSELARRMLDLARNRHDLEKILGGEPRPILVPTQMHGDPTVKVRYEGTPRPGDPSVRASAPPPTSSAYASGPPIVVRRADASADALELEGVRHGDPSVRSR